MTTAIYIFACGGRQAKRAKAQVKFLRHYGFAGKINIVCQSWDYEVLTDATMVPVPVKQDGLYYSQLVMARHTKIDPWSFGLTYPAADYIVCTEPDVLLSMPWSSVESQLDGRIFCEVRDPISGSRERLGGVNIGTGVVALPNNHLGKEFSRVASSRFERDSDMAMEAYQTVGSVLGFDYFAPAPFAGLYDHGGPWAMTHYHTPQGKRVFSDVVAAKAGTLTSMAG